MSKRKTKTKKKTVKNKKTLAGCIAAIVVVIVAALLDMTGIATYEDIMVILNLSDGQVTDAEVSVHFIDVGQGDSILIRSGDENILIDAGEVEYGETVLAYLRNEGITKLDYVVATHPHSDHIGGIAEVIDNVDVENVIAPKVSSDMTPSSNVYKAFLTSVKEKGLSITAASPGKKYSIGECELLIMGPCEHYDDLNNYSVVTKLTHGQNTFLFTGDAEKKSENDILDEGYDVDVDVLKAGHHGSSTSSGKKFLEAVTPEYAVIMCGVGNSYNHPSESVMESLSSMTDEIYRTDLQGTIVALSDGNDIEFKVKGK